MFIILILFVILIFLIGSSVITVYYIDYYKTTNRKVSTPVPYKEDIFDETLNEIAGNPILVRKVHLHIYIDEIQNLQI